MGAVKYLSFTTRRKFGVEVEVTNHIAKEVLKTFVEAADPAHECKVSNANDKDYGNDYWKVKHDGSCKDEEFNAGSELSSFVGSGVKDIALVGKVVEKLRDQGVKVNDNCSVHIHVEVSDFTKKQLAKAVALWMKIEPIILQMVPKRRRESIYCVPLRKFHKSIKPDECRYSVNEFWHAVKPPYHDDKHRRVTFNICNVCSALDKADYDYYGEGQNKYKKRMTVELRLPEGTVDPRQVMNWIKIFVRFVNLAKIKKSPEDLKPLSLTDTLHLLGLHGTEDDSVILSRGLWSLKVWFLERILEFCSDKELEKEAFSLLEFISSPYRTYDEKEFKQTGKKKAAKKAEQGSKYGVEHPILPEADWLGNFAPAKNELLKEFGW